METGTELKTRPIAVCSGERLLRRIIYSGGHNNPGTIGIINCPFQIYPENQFDFPGTTQHNPLS